MTILFFFSSRRRHTRCSRDWSSDVCSSDLLALAEQGPDVRRHKTWIVEGPRAAGKARLRAQAVAVVEYLGAPVQKRDHPVHMARHALSRASDVHDGLVEPQLR